MNRMLSLGLLAVFASNVVVAVTPVSLTTFSPNTSISSSAVNANFVALKTPVDTLNNSNAGLYIFPVAYGSAGSVLTTDGTGNLSWTPTSGGGITSLNGSPNPSQALAVGSTGSAPTWVTSSGVHTLNIPSASMPGVTDGTISYSDWMNFNNKMTAPIGTAGQILMHNGSMWQAANGNFFVPGGNSLATNAMLGTNDAFALGFKTNGSERMRIDPAGRVGIGTISPMGTLHVSQGGANTAPSTGTLMVEGTLDASSGTQYGAKIATQVYQSSGAAYSGLTVYVNDSSSTGMGTRKLLDLQNNSGTAFSVNRDGYITNGSSEFLGAVSGTVNPSCTMSAVTNVNSTQVTSMGPYEFGTFSGSFLVSTASIYEVIVDLPVTPSGSVGSVEMFLWNGSIQVKLVQGLNIKRLAVGTWSMYVGCTTAGTGSVTVQNSNSIFGIRKFH